MNVLPASASVAAVQDDGKYAVTVNKKIVMYIFVNTDLKMGKGKIASQVGHVVGMIVEEIVRNSYDLRSDESKADYELYAKWKKCGGMAKIVLRATEDELRDIIKHNRCKYVIDAGKTQIAPNSLTVVGFFPRDDLSEKFEQYKLLN
jgi:PTH2 family peptidyl-tRNA hydrolase